MTRYMIDGIAKDPAGKWTARAGALSKGLLRVFPNCLPFDPALPAAEAREAILVIHPGLGHGVPAADIKAFCDDAVPIYAKQYKAVLIVARQDISVISGKTTESGFDNVGYLIPFADRSAARALEVAEGRQKVMPSRALVLETSDEALTEARNRLDLFWKMLVSYLDEQNYAKMDSKDRGQLLDGLTW